MNHNIAIGYNAKVNVVKYNCSGKFPKKPISKELLREIILQLLRKDYDRKNTISTL